MCSWTNGLTRSVICTAWAVTIPPKKVNGTTITTTTKRSVMTAAQERRSPIRPAIRVYSGYMSPVKMAAKNTGIRNRRIMNRKRSEIASTRASKNARRARSGCTRTVMADSVAKVA